MKYEEINITDDEIRNSKFHDKEFADLIIVVQMTFKRPLRKSEVKALLWILRGSCFDVLMVYHLVDYCLFAMHVKDVQDIFFMAQKWIESGIDNLHSAEEKYRLPYGCRWLSSDNVPTTANPSQPKSEHRICPVCGKAMVKRTARQGKYVGQQFWGCTGYPNCKYLE